MYPLGATVSEQRARPRCWGRRPGPLPAAPRVFPSGQPSKVKGGDAISQQSPRPKAAPTHCDHPPWHSTLGHKHNRLSPEDRCEYNRPTPRTLVGKPSLLCPAGRAIHAARDGPPRAPTRPGSAGPGLRRRGKLWLSPAHRLSGDRKDGSGVRTARVRRRGAGAYLRGSGATCGRRDRPSAASEGQSAGCARQ